ncbi:hypothetical protein JR316_0001553 [Psilocybe cubensis]|uniref:Uncharacterized protein n=1 Tax=Psilocybe cubensis TaxID=181762 RepID=A0ACB8HI79_PSICU|nr:hypothetical protein JR316_0001553 [Psilocybe cubensis]KAH9487477.1 hypothetical protein JR316_0001553 [Psilocybe cubensis]
MLGPCLETLKDFSVFAASSGMENGHVLACEPLPNLSEMNCRSPQVGEGDAIQASIAMANEAGGPAPNKEVKAGSQDVPWQFSQNLGNDVGGPAVHSAWVLPDLVDSTGSDEGNLQHVHQRLTVEILVSFVNSTK